MAEETHSPSSPHHPLLRAVLVCDYIIRDGESGKVSLVGIFSNMHAFSFPVLQPECFVYVNMDEAEGEYLIRLELRRVDGDVLLGAAELPFNVADRFKPAELVFQLKGLVFDRPGRYEFSVSANKRHIGAKAFHVVKIEEGSSL